MLKARLGMLTMLLSLLACGTPLPAADAGDDDAGAADAGGPDDGGTDAGVDGGVDAGSSSTVTFRYTPQWPGVTAVTVLGGFGLATDWSKATPFATLTNDGTGSFVGTASLDAGTYTYLLRVTGDSAANGTSFARYAVDPSTSAYVPCPPQSPSFTAHAANPCSSVTVPQSAPDAVYAIHGEVTYDAAPVAGYLVELEREEPGSHHFFVNRANSKANGTFSFDAAPGVYRLQVLFPTSLRQSDLQRDPLTLQALRRSLSTPVKVTTAAAEIPPVEMAFHGYAQMEPRDAGAQALPVTFHFPLMPSAAMARGAVYGGQDGGLTEVGDPWWASTYSASGQATFNGQFNTAQADETQAKAGERYFWGAWQQSHPDGGVQWTGQTMVFPVSFQ